MKQRITKLELKLERIFRIHRFVLVDAYEYDGKKVRIPKKRIVSYKWLARAILRK